MNPMPEIVPMLKQLRLSGFLDSLESRNREAIAGKLAYPEFLALLVQDEIARREQTKFATRIRRAGFRAQKTVEEFDFGFNPSINQTLITELATARFVAEPANVLIVGPCGTGKSHLAQAFGHAAVRQGYDVLFATQAQLVGSLQTARAIGTYERRFRALAKVKLLIIDDLGLRPLRPQQDEDLHELIAERHERAPTIVTSNLDFSEWTAAFPNRLLGAATVDRLRHNAYLLVLEGRTYRLPKTLLESKKHKKP